MQKMMNERLPISKSSPLKARFFDYSHFSYPWHFHSEYEIIYIREGRGTRFVGNSIEKYADGDIVLIGSNLPHYMKSDDIYFAENSMLKVKGTIIQFEKEFMYHAINYYPHFIKIRKMLYDSQKGIYFSGSSCLGLGNLLDILPTVTGMNQMILFLQLLKEMSETISKRVISSVDSIDFTNDALNGVSRIDKVISYLNKNYNQPVNLEEVSSLAAMNPSAFCRFFKNKTGKSFKNYVLDMRIEYACKLLIMDNMSVSQVSAECGFDTISHFNKTFKKNTGYNPSQYKLIMLNEPNNHM